MTLNLSVRQETVRVFIEDVGRVTLRSRFAQVSLIPSLVNIPDDDPTHCGPAEIPTKGMFSF